MPLGSTVALATDRILRPVEGMHWTISNRWFNAIGPAAAPVRAIHDTIVGTTYKTIRASGTLVGFGLDARVDLDEARADGLTAFVTGVLGHSAAGFDVPMEVRGVDTPATGHIVVLVHGLTETERIFDGDEGVLAAIQDAPALTAVTVRYHTGLPVAQNGQRLAELLANAVADWPVEVESISIVGRSMGGLVARSACASAESQSWIELVTTVVTIGTPHRGSYVERIAEVAAKGLGIAPDTRPLAAVLEGRSDGIKDLHDGSDVALPDGIEHHFIGGVLTAEAKNPFGRLVGDALVGLRSAAGHGLQPTGTMTVTSTAHSSLHRHPDVVDAVLAWVSPDPA